RSRTAATFPVAPLHGGLLMPFGYPVLLELAGRRCVVVGGLPVREGKAEGLLAAGATDVVVVAPEPSDRLDDLEGLDDVLVLRRTWYATDFAGAFLVIAHDPDPAVRARIATAAREAGALVNVVDDIPQCDWAAPAVVRRGELLRDRHRRRIAGAREEDARAAGGPVRPRMGRGPA